MVCFKDIRTRLQRHWRGINRVLAVLLICIGGFSGYWWLYKLSPSRRTLDPEWCASHSQRAYWCEVQKGIRRGIWCHDDSFIVGMYGDKSLAEWIMAHVKPGTTMGCTGSLSHSAHSMRHITNQDVGEGAGEWIAWWAKNRSKSQHEWIADGFRKRGFVIDVPPTAEQTPVLLSMLGNRGIGELPEPPSETKYNAFRCLRDSGFEPVAFALSNRNVSAEIESGLLEYAKQQHDWPLSGGVGILSFGEKEDELESNRSPAIQDGLARIATDAFVFGLPLFGIVLLVRSFRRRADTVA